MATIHRMAETGFASKAATYATGRPDYPNALNRWLTETLDLGPAKVALDLGAGTGKFTANLVSTGADVIAVEPIAQMREILSANSPNVDARLGTAEAIPVADRSIDVVACAQAFHWFATSAALSEIHRVLKPGGRLILIWNVRDERVGWVRALTDIMTPHEGDAPRFHTGAWKSVFPANGFGPLSEIEFTHAHIGRPEAVIVDRTLSISFIAALPSTEQDKVRSKLDALISTTPELKDAPIVTFPYLTRVFTAKKID